MKLVLQSLFPFLVWLPRVSRESLRADFIAGLTGAVIVLPQGIAFATIAGLPPEYGSRDHHVLGRGARGVHRPHCGDLRLRLRCEGSGALVPWSELT